MVRTAAGGGDVRVGFERGESALGILQRGGVTGERAVAIFSGIIALNYGWTAFTAARETVQPAGEVHELPPLGETLAALPLDQFPLTVAVAQPMGGLRH